MQTIWTAALKNAKRSERVSRAYMCGVGTTTNQNNIDWMGGLLEKILLENVYTLLHSTSLPQAVWANDDVENVSHTNC